MAARVHKAVPQWLWVECCRRWADVLTSFNWSKVTCKRCLARRRGQ